MSRIKVLMVGMTNGIGGVESFIINVNNHINRNQFQIDYLVHQEINDKYLTDISKTDSEIYNVTGIKNGLFKYIKSVFSFYNSCHYDVVHLNECGARYFVYCLPLLFKKDSILIVHSHNGSSGNKIVHKVFCAIQNLRIDKKWACSDVAAEWMFGKSVIKNHDYTLIKNGIDLNAYKYNSQNRTITRNRMGIKENTIVLGSIARFEKQKNHIRLINIFEYFHKKNSNSVLVLVGKGSEEENIKTIVNEKQLTDCVFFLGIRSDIPELLSAFDVFLLPSLYEGLPFVAIEAQAASLPLITSDTVSNEICVTELVKQIKLDAHDFEWVNTIEKMYLTNEERLSEKYIEKLRDNGFDIVETVKFIEREYSNSIMNVGKGA